MFFCLFIKWKHNYGKLCIGCLHVLDHIDYGWGKKRMWIENAQNQDLFNDIYILTSANHASHCSRTKWLEIIIKWWETVAKNKKIKKKDWNERFLWWWWWWWWSLSLEMVISVLIASAMNNYYDNASYTSVTVASNLSLYIAVAMNL